jgi:cellulose synthase/poly-beta-1,6-N-acetylglucosamine synthase-like glycosyltransferase
VILPELIACLLCGIQLILLSRLAYGWWRMLFFSHSICKSVTYPKVSIIIAIHNEAANLKCFFQALLKQNYPGTYEIIAVNDRSTDNSGQLLHSFKELYPHLLHIIEIKECPANISPKKYAITIAIHQSQAEIVVLTDADCLVGPDWLAAMVNPFVQDQEGKLQFVLGFSPHMHQNGLLDKIIGAETLHTAFLYLGFAAAGMPYMAVGRNLAYRKSVFIAHQGFAQHQHILSGDDDLLVNRLANSTNTRCVISPAAIVYTRPVRTWQQWFNQKHRHKQAGHYYQFSTQITLVLYHFTSFATIIYVILALFIQGNSYCYWFGAPVVIIRILLLVLVGWKLRQLRYVFPVYDLIAQLLEWYNTLRSLWNPKISQWK